MELFVFYLITDIFITVNAWRCALPILEVYSDGNSSAILPFSADLTKLNSPRQFEVQFYDGTPKGRIVYSEGDGVTYIRSQGVNMTGDDAGNVNVTLNHVFQNNTGLYIMTSAGFSTKCICLYLLGQPSKPNITLSRTPFVGENAILSCDSISNTVPRNHSLTMNYTWEIDGQKDPEESRFFYSTYRKTLTISEIVKDDKNRKIRCSAIESANFSSENSDSLSFIVYYGPDGVDINVDSPYILTEGDTNKQIRCTSVCYPSCTFHWTHLQSGDLVGTGGLLSFNTVNRSDTGEYNCTARNTAALYSTDTLKHLKHVNLHVIVHYPPLVTVRSSTQDFKEGLAMTLFCEGDGVPSENKYICLTQTVANVKIPNTNSALNGTERFSSIHFSSLLLQDTGTYTCTLNNGIKTANGDLNQSGSKDLFVEASPKVLTDDLRFSGSFQGVGRIKVSIYSFPAIKYVKLLRPDGALISSSTYNISKSIVETSFYGKKVSLNGSVFFFELRDVKEDDFGNYTLELNNQLGTTTRNISFLAEGRPSAPTLFQYLPGEAPAFLWKKNFNGGLVQSFIIQISINGTNIWTNTTNILEIDTKYQINGSYFSTEIHGLKPGIYTARLISKNSKGESDIVELGRTFEVVQLTENQTPIAAIVGGCVCVVVVIFIGVLVLVMIRRTRNRGKRKASCFKNTAGHDQDNEEEESEVNTVNPMYAPADEMQDATYAQPIKKKKAEREESNLYSVVTKEKGPGKKGKQNLPKGGIENREQEKSQKLVNKDGLIYADLTFNNKKMGQKKIFRNIDDSMTEYVEVDFSKKADPLPDSDDESHIPKK